MIESGRAVHVLELVPPFDHADDRAKPQ